MEIVSKKECIYGKAENMYVSSYKYSTLYFPDKSCFSAFQPAMGLRIDTVKR